MQDIKIRCTNLARYYDTQEVIRQFNLNVYGGEFVALLGESGCGKTTLLRLIAGFDRPNEGTIEIAGRQVAGPNTFVPPERRRIGMVFQDYALFPHMTVLHNVGYGLRNVPDKQNRIRETLDLVGLNDLGERYPSELSGGQQQRVALARALAPRPDVILLDEPFSNLDASLRVRLRLELREILAQSKVTTILVTHDQEEALSLADRVALLQNGDITQIASPETLYLKPATRQIAEFVGETNFVPGFAEGDHVTVSISPTPIALHQAMFGPVDVLLRPEWILPKPDPNGTDIVQRRIYFGHDQLMVVSTQAGQLLQVRLGPDKIFSSGDRVRLSVQGPVVAYPRQNKNEKNTHNTKHAVPSSTTM